MGTNEAVGSCILRLSRLGVDVTNGRSDDAVVIYRCLGDRWVTAAWKRLVGTIHSRCAPTKSAAIRIGRLEDLRRSYWQDVLNIGSDDARNGDVTQQLKALKRAYRKLYREIAAAPVHGPGNVGRPRTHLPDKQMFAEALLVSGILEEARRLQTRPAQTGMLVIQNLKEYYMSTDDDNGLRKLARLKTSICRMVTNRRATNTIVGALHDISPHLVARIRFVTAQEK